MKWGLAAGASAGLLLAVVLIAYQGWGAVAQAMLGVGWGIIVVTVYHLLPMGFSALAWRGLLREQWTASRRVFFAARWVREHVGHLLPVAQIGGELVGARLLTLRGLKTSVAGASVVVDLTLEVLTQIIFTLIGLALLAKLGGSQSLLLSGAAGAVLGFCVIAAFFWAQKKGLFAWFEASLSKIDASSNRISLGDMNGLHAAIQALYRDRRGVLTATIFHLMCWIGGAGEVWLTLYFMGHPVSWAQALFLESLGEAIRSVAFFVPGQLGVQEGAYMVLGRLIGLAPDVGLALSLVKRARVLLLGVPALLYWQALEGKWLWQKRRG